MPIRSLTPLTGRRYPTSDIYNQFEEFINDFDRAFALPRFASAAAADTDYTPALDFEERSDSYFITVDLPGLRKEDIKLDLQDGVLSISGERLREAAGEGRYTERPAGRFSRAVTLPSQVNADKIEAQFANGVLNITLPKTESAKPHAIKIQ